ncbi:MAG: hypothetical protein CVT67_02925 [Actinobacteria bacterium HGW-Actinobacteria-7]|jgi:N6-adenosine-specific RNA methylase IME4|nr:MAG: hypothetical protein CVT67_02925 [Actinobacteria bacterium HGW-Actinobacteria-7]
MAADYSEFLDGLEAHVSSVWNEVNKPRAITRRSRNQRAKSCLVATPQMPPDTPPLPEGHFPVIYSDPAWSYDDKGNVNAPDYPTLSVAQMSQLEVPSRNHPEGTVHFMWATLPLLPDALRLMGNWGYQYKTVAFVWVKSKGEDADDNPLLYVGRGSYTNPNAEIVLLGVSGKAPVRKDKRVRQIVFAELDKEHSAKPEEVRRRIERLYTSEPKLELFARNRFVGWEPWGKDVDKGVQQPSSPTDGDVITFKDPKVRDGISTRQAAEIISAKSGTPVGAHRVLEFIKEERLKGYKVGNQYVLSKAEVEAFAKKPRSGGRPKKQ